MSILTKIFGGETEAPARPGAGDPECAHRALVPRWKSVADMGNPSRISAYYCEGCGTLFSRTE